MSAQSQKSLQILLVEDDEGDALLVERALTAGREASDVQRVSSMADALKLLTASTFELVILDLSLPDSFGLQGLERLREIAPLTAVVVLTGLDDADVALEALNRGAQDYLFKSELTAASLRRTLQFSIQRNQILAENQRLLARLQRQARYDSLTEVLNRHSLNHELEKEWARSKRTGLPLACAMFDIDFFKKTNDTYGHAAGDVVLQVIAKLVQEECRLSDVLGRYGGEEFCVLLPDTDENGAAIWADRVRERIESTVIPINGTELNVTASFGVAQRECDMSSPAELVDHADQAMLVSKQIGRNHVTCFKHMTGKLSERQDCARDILADLTAGEIMTPLVATLPDDSSLMQVAQFLLELRLDSAPIVDSGGNLKGVVSEDDIVGIWSSPECCHKPLTGIMNSRPACFAIDAPARRVYDFLRRVSLRRVFILDGSRPVGIVRRGNFVRWLRNFWCQTARSDVGELPSQRATANLRATLDELQKQACQLSERFTRQQDRQPDGAVWGPSRHPVPSVARDGHDNELLPGCCSDDPVSASEATVLAATRMQELLEEMMVHANQLRSDHEQWASLQLLLG